MVKTTYSKTKEKRYPRGQHNTFVTLSSTGHKGLSLYHNNIVATLQGMARKLTSYCTWIQLGRVLPATKMQSPSVSCGLLVYTDIQSIP